MVLSKEYKYVILCEDKQTQCFMRYFLLEHGIERHKVISVGLPMTGCGEQYVRENYPKELKRIRSANYNKICLFVVTDADIYKVSDRAAQLNNACQAANVPIRQVGEPVIFFIPKRNIETWIRYYAGDETDENAIYPHNRGRESECRPMAEKMARSFMGQNHDLIELTSIMAAKNEYDRISLE